MARLSRPLTEAPSTPRIGICPVFYRTTGTDIRETRMAQDPAAELLEGQIVEELRTIKAEALRAERS
jgi:hypothetical protein